MGTTEGALAGVRVIELAGMGALPFASLKLADMGADVVRVDRVSDVEADSAPQPYSAWNRGRRSVAFDLKAPAGVDAVLRLVEGADVLMESFRPGVTERLGLGPEVCLGVNPALVYGRLTGWGQSGPRAQQAGHSLNYEAVTGVIRAVGRPDRPPAPQLQLLGDFAGGGLSLAYGVVCALFEAQRTGTGQVVDANMVDGVMSLAQVFYAMAESGMHTDERGTNLFDGGAPFYDVYECSDGGFLSVAPIEPHFYAQLLDGLGLDPSGLPDQYDQVRWPELRDALAAVIGTRSRDDWVARFEGSDACVAPVLSFTEAMADDHNRGHGTFRHGDGSELVAVPRLSAGPVAPSTSPTGPGADTDEVLREAGFTEAEISALRSSGAAAGG
jgi:alpha-methylacyl-CoA racemase